MPLPPSFLTLLQNVEQHLELPPNNVLKAMLKISVPPHQYIFSEFQACEPNLLLERILIKTRAIIELISKGDKIIYIDKTIKTEHNNSNFCLQTIMMFCKKKLKFLILLI